MFSNAKQGGSFTKQTLSARTKPFDFVEVRTPTSLLNVFSKPRTGQNDQAVKKALNSFNAGMNVRRPSCRGIRNHGSFFAAPA